MGGFDGELKEMPSSIILLFMGDTRRVESIGWIPLLNRLYCVALQLHSFMSEQGSHVVPDLMCFTCSTYQGHNTFFSVFPPYQQVLAFMTPDSVTY